MSLKTFKQFTEQLAYKNTVVPEITFSQWLRNCGKVELHDAQVAAAIGMLVFPTPGRTGRQKGTETTVVEQWQQQQREYERYLLLVPKVTVTRRLNLEYESDKAYVRVRYKRYCRKNGFYVS